jgi:hypothetical protein
MDKISELFSKIPAWIKLVTAVFAVIPSLINSAYNIYAEVAKLPRTEDEAVSKMLFEKYFGKEPVNKLTLNIVYNDDQIPAEFKIYSEGDTLVKYGTTNKWLPFPKNRPAQSFISYLIPSAHAQQFGNPRPAEPYRERQQMKDGYLISERVTKSGEFSREKIDLRSGEAYEITKRRATSQELKSLSFEDEAASRRSARESAKGSFIDLNGK